MRLGISQHDGDRLLVFIANPVGDDPARTIAIGQIGLGNAIDQLLALAAILDQLLDGDDLQVVLPCQIVELVARGALAAVGQHFAKNARGLKPGHAGQVNRRLGMPGPAKHPPFFGDQRRDVAGAEEIVRLAGGIDDGQDRGGPLLGGNAGTHAAMIDGNREIRSQGGRIILHHGVEIESLAGSGRSGTQSCPRPLSMKLMISGVTFSAAR